MNFIEAIQAVKNGACVRRNDWVRKYMYHIPLSECFAIIEQDADLKITHTINPVFGYESILALDWEIVE